MKRVRKASHAPELPASTGWLRYPRSALPCASTHHLSKRPCSEPYEERNQNKTDYLTNIHGCSADPRSTHHLNEAGALGRRRSKVAIILKAAVCLLNTKFTRNCVLKKIIFWGRPSVMFFGLFGIEFETVKKLRTFRSLCGLTKRNKDLKLLVNIQWHLFYQFC